MTRSIKSLGDRMLAKFLPEATAAAGTYCQPNSWTTVTCTSEGYKYSEQCVQYSNCVIHCTTTFVGTC